MSFLFKCIAVLALPLIFVSVLIYGIPRYAYSLMDWYRLQNYSPSTEIAELSEKAYFTDKGEKIFYVNDPQLNDKAEFNTNCPFHERTFVLGCFTGSRIFLLSVTDDQLKSVETVTAAHEMLHAAYLRLSTKERDRVDSLLEKTYKEKADQRLISLIDEYEKHDPKAVPNELHSILPTELEELSPELEEYFAQYFSDRSKVVEAYLSYEQIFRDLEQKIDTTEAEITSLKSKITELDGKIKSSRAELDAINAQLEKLRGSGDISGYNALVPKQNQLVNSYNADVRSYNAAIVNHNAKVKEFNEIVVQQNSKVNSIDSKHDEI